ncbi:MAG: glycerophosphoryl diester phosphodiesterase membrane domain-containing protein [Candidatus Nanosalina sp.]
MSVDALDVLRTSFGSLKTSTGQKLVAIFFVTQLLNIGSSYLMESMSMMVLASALGLLGGLGAIVATIGGLRSLREDEVRLENFTSNIIWPFGRILGANITTAVFAYAVSLIFLGPAFIAGVTSGITSLTSLTGASLGILALAVLGGILGIGALFYVSITMILAQPFIAIEDMRMFEALDESIQKTKNNRLSIFAAFLGLMVAYIGVAALMAIVSSFTPSPELAQSGITAVLGAVMAPVSMKILEEFADQLS